MNVLSRGGFAVDTIGPKEPDNANQPLIPKPTGTWGTVLTATPIALTVLATVFAGASDTQMNEAMYFRSMAAQHQSKAADQWGFFQAKRIRGTNLEMTMELLQGLAHPGAFDPQKVDEVLAHMLQLLEKAVAAGNSDAAAAAAKIKTIREKLAGMLADKAATPSLAVLKGGALPKVAMRTLPNQEVQQQIDSVVHDIDERKTESETAPLVSKLQVNDIDAATKLAEEDAKNVENVTDPITKTLKELHTLLAEVADAVSPFRNTAELAQVTALADQLNNSFRAAFLSYDAKRYQQEADFNRHAAAIYEVSVRHNSGTAEQYRQRSKKLFYCLVLAQAGVTLSSLALARAQHSLFWLLAALAGAVALGFSTYAYLVS
jgi:hypothetical protein